MNPEKQNPGEIYAARAMRTEEPVGSPISIPRVREPRDMVYSDATIGRPEAVAPTATVSRPRSIRKRRTSPFTMILILLGVAVVSVLYVSNILSVGRLLTQIDEMDGRHRQMLNEQEMLHAQISRLSSLERVEKAATELLNLQPPTEPPVWIEIDPARVEELREILGNRK